MNKPHILVVDDVQTSTKMTEFMLVRAGYEVTSFNSPVEALQWINNPDNHTDLIISDLNMPQMDGHYFVKRVRRREKYADLPVIILTAVKEQEMVVTSLKLGVAAYLVKPVNPHELLHRIQILLKRQPAAGGTNNPAEPPPSQGSVITTFSLRGGSGVTTLAVNLAVALAKLWQKPIPLFDFTVQNSHCAWFLNLTPQKTLADLARSKENPSLKKVEALMLEHTGGVKLVPAPASPLASRYINAALLNHFWADLIATNPITVVDGGSVLNEVTLTTLNRSQFVVVPVTPEQASVQAAANLLEMFKQMEYPAEKVVVVLNQTLSQNALSESEVEERLGVKPALIIPHTPDFVQAVNTQTPLLAADEVTPIAKLIAQLAYQLSPDTLKSAPPAQATELFNAVADAMPPVPVEETAQPEEQPESTEPPPEQIEAA